MLNRELKSKISIPITSGPVTPLSESLVNPYDEIATNELIKQCLPD